jgi:pimeloyl-ACP methyl ester carboxylesterase
MFRELRHQQEHLDQLCLMSGTIRAQAPPDVPRIVLLLTRRDGNLRLQDHFVAEGDGRWMIVAPPGNYTLAAFADRSRDLIYQPGEPILNASESAIVHCDSGTRREGVRLEITGKGRAFAREVDHTALHPREPEEQLDITFAAMTALGTVTTLDDPRFSSANVKAGMWAPYDFLANAGPGIYFLEPYDAHKIPVLLVHGIGGSPLDFATIIRQLDRTRFQPWLYYYPSGVRLQRVAEHLDQAVTRLQLQYPVRSYVVVAHSMGGLIAREFLLLQQEHAARANVAMFVSLSTPWGVHHAAQMGLNLAPTPVRSWIDMAPASDYLKGLFAGPAHQRRTLTMPYFLLFSYKKSGSSFGESGDEVVTLASELRAEAQSEASAVYGFNSGHTAILQDADAGQLLLQLLDWADQSDQPSAIRFPIEKKTEPRISDVPMVLPAGS